MNKAKARRIYTSGNTVLDNRGNVWNVLEVDTNIKSARYRYQLMQLRNARGGRSYRWLIQGAPGRTAKTAQRNLIRKYYKDGFKNVKYDAIHNQILKIIE